MKEIRAETNNLMKMYLSTISFSNAEREGTIKRRMVPASLPRNCHTSTH